jgi:hypothetical protein
MEWNPQLQHDVAETERKLKKLQARYDNLNDMTEPEVACSCESQCKTEKGWVYGTHKPWCQLNNSGNRDKQLTLEDMYSRGAACTIPTLNREGHIDRSKPSTPRPLQKYTGNWVTGQKRFYRQCDAPNEDYAFTPNGVWANHVPPDESWATDIKVAGGAAAVGATLAGGWALGVPAMLGFGGTTAATGATTAAATTTAGLGLTEAAAATAATAGAAKKADTWMGGRLNPLNWWGGNTGEVDSATSQRLSDAQLNMLDRDDPMRLDEMRLRNSDEAAKPLSWSENTANPMTWGRQAEGPMTQADYTAEAQRQDAWSDSYFNPESYFRTAAGPMTQAASSLLQPVRNITRTDGNSAQFTANKTQVFTQPQGYNVGSNVWQANENAKRAANEAAQRRGQELAAARPSGYAIGSADWQANEHAKRAAFEAKQRQASENAKLAAFQAEQRQARDTVILEVGDPWGKMSKNGKTYSDSIEGHREMVRRMQNHPRHAQDYEYYKNVFENTFHQQL